MKMVSPKVSHQKNGFNPIILQLVEITTQIFSRDAHLERHMALGHFVSPSCLELHMQNANFGYVTRYVVKFCIT